MQRRHFGSIGHDVPIVGQGSWNIEAGDRARAVAALRRGFELGMTHIDTAEMYGSGKAEEIIAEALAQRRERAFVVSKVLPENASRQGTIAACERSLKRLRTDRLDCYLLHWRGSHPLAETIAAFEQLRRDGKILSWGVSNFDVADLEEALRLAGPGKIACNQVLYHLRQRAIEHAVLPWCDKHGVAVVGYTPYGSGEFPAPSSQGGRTLAELAARHSATPRQVALSFLVRQAPLFTIPKSARTEHVEENAGAGALVLTAQDIASIDKAFPRGRAPRELPTL
jgi:diketogulonate reductase-like aldo/keto reductase